MLKSAVQKLLSLNAIIAFFFAQLLWEEQEQVFVAEKPLSNTEPLKELTHAAKWEAFHIFT